MDQSRTGTRERNGAAQTTLRHRRLPKPALIPWTSSPALIHSKSNENESLDSQKLESRFDQGRFRSFGFSCKAVLIEIKLRSRTQLAKLQELREQSQICPASGGISRQGAWQISNRYTGVYLPIPLPETLVPPELLPEPPAPPGLLPGPLVSLAGVFPEPPVPPGRLPALSTFPEMFAAPQAPPEAFPAPPAPTTVLLEPPELLPVPPHPASIAAIVAMKKSFFILA